MSKNLRKRVHDLANLDMIDRMLADVRTALVIIATNNSIMYEVPDDYRLFVVGDSDNQGCCVELRFKRETILAEKGVQ